MRALLAGLFVFIMMLVVVGILGSLSPNHDLPSWGTPVILITLVGSIVASMFIFNKPGNRPGIPGKSAAEQIREMDEQGLLVSQSFKGIRTFQVEEFEDEGLHYFIELEDKTVLYLNGQYLYDYSEITDDPDVNQARTFPCSEFTVRRHKTKGFVVEIVCNGKALPIDCEAPSFDKKDDKLNLIPEDGEIIRDRSYDDLKKERLKGRTR